MGQTDHFRLRKTYLFLILFTFAVNIGYSQPNIGGSSGAFLRVGLSGRTKAMGNAGTAIAQGYSTAYDNPSFLTKENKKLFGLTMHKLALDRRFSHVAFVTPLKGNAGLSLSWINAGVNEIDSRDVDGHHLEYLSYYDNAFSLGFGITPVPNKFSFGINVKVLYALFPRIKDDNQSLKATGVGFDLGSRIQIKQNIVIGIVVKDIAGKYTWNTDGYWSQGSTKVDKFPIQYFTGVAYQNYKWTVTSDAVITKSKQTLRLGAEYIYWNDQWLSASIRGGMDGTSPTFGCGFKWSMVRDLETSLDYGYIIEKIAPENTHILTWTVYFE